jgi:hypothetical protein
MAEALMQFSSGGDVGGIPSGVICMWSGASTEIPDSWALCDGTNGTPDLRDRFIVGAGSSYSVGDTGGRNTVTLTTSEMPKHTHVVYSANGGSSTSKGFSAAITTYTVASVATSSAGSGDAHENRPPYYALCFIMKL